MITINKFQEKGHSLGSDLEPDWTVGLIEPGVYDLGIAKRREIIWVHHGAIFVRGIAYPTLAHPYVVFERGQRIAFEVRDKPAAYICDAG